MVSEQIEVNSLKFTKYQKRNLVAVPKCKTHKTLSYSDKIRLF